MGSLGAVAADKTTPVYTSDLSLWGPGENKLELSPHEPRYWDLQEAEREKILGCSGAALTVVLMKTLAAGSEATVDVLAKHGGPAREQPFGKLAENVLHNMVELELGDATEWPSLTNGIGRQVAAVYALHFGFQFWEQDYQSSVANPPQIDRKFNHELTEQFWSLCLQQIPTACFEKGEVDRQRCLPELIHPRDFPNYELTSDLFQQVLKPKSW